MKKVTLFLGSALFVAGMMFSCGNNNAEAVEEDTTATEEVKAEEAPAPEAAAPVATSKEEILSKAREAGQAKCNCYKTDAASVEKCFQAILDQTYAAYKDDADFQAEMKAEYNRCIKGKVKDAAKEATNKAVKEGAKAASEAATDALKNLGK
ncbi:MAG: hypothetical protein J6Z26_02695 [Bacteroidales bacterium]|nr:hypothetical protein [Bacteroidales bacterium]